MTITINGTTGIAGVDGSAGTPAVQGADTNTGIFFGTDTVTISTGGTAAVTVDSGQRTKFPTTIGVGGATPSTSGSGISFPATASASSDANTLDDYEEGTFTATMSPATSGTITLSSTINELAYTKIGRVVTIIGSISIGSVGSPVGTYVNLSNLPFTSADLTEQAGRSGGAVTTVDDTPLTYTASPTLMLESSTEIRIYLTAANLAAGDAFFVSFSYFSA
jgi:hypothetical protein